jgi:Xaa-Pro dipeptidase
MVLLRAQPANVQYKSKEKTMKSPKEKILSMMLEENIDGLLLVRRDSFSWFTGGSYNHVLQTTEAGIAYLYVTKHSIKCITTNNEKARLEAEEILNKEIEIVACPWYEDLNSFTASFFKENVGSDDGRFGTVNVFKKIQQMRASLSEDEVNYYYSLGKDTASLVEQVCLTCEPGMSENEIASMVASQCISKGINPVCLLVAADERIEQYKHPIPTENKLKRTLMIVIGAERHGLNISLTRFVHFGDIPQVQRDRINALANVHARMIFETKVSVPYKDILEKTISFYEQEGYGDDWRLHHQGGPTGYACREEIVTLKTEGIVLRNQPFAWNPSFIGIKSEETFLVRDNGIELLTRTDKWPTIECNINGNVYKMADILIRDKNAAK